MKVFRTGQSLSVMSDSEALVMFVTLDGKDPVRNISEKHRIAYTRKGGKRKKRK
jgi:hypothetical protein